ncbi:hypothetical protein V8B55DRAFT_1570182 [Mucor lusitanicus]|uniref:Uncharacterized protein n=1 Tax=Mucor circinelloides f. lusitanicus TaxID=29924 RepID=A0A8H4BR94_MUCCL|nr:hypothetical protein FB192DRAFT_1017502 [Mucor lusitanicus]
MQSRLYICLFYIVALLGGIQAVPVGRDLNARNPSAPFLDVPLDPGESNYERSPFLDIGTVVSNLHDPIRAISNADKGFIEDLLRGKTGDETSNTQRSFL